MSDFFVRVRVLATALVVLTFGLVVVGGSPATAVDGPKPCTEGTGWTEVQVNALTYTQSAPPGSVITEVCAKGPDGSVLFVDGPFEAGVPSYSFDAANYGDTWKNSNGQVQEISHIGYKFSERPAPEQVTETHEDCDLSAYGAFGAGTITRTGLQAYVWNAASSSWVLEPAAGIDWGVWQFTPYTDEQYFAKCAGDKPSPERVVDTDQGCDLSSYDSSFGAGSVERVGVREYVWSAQARQWVLEPESGIEWGAWSFTRFTDDEYFEACAPDQPAPETRRVSGSNESCELAGVAAWVDVYSTPYVWNATQRAWVLGQETGPVRTQQTFTPYTDDEYFEKCAPDQPEPDSRQVPRSDESCQLGGVTSWIDVYTTPYVWDAGKREWVRGQETGPVRIGETFTAFTDQEYFDECAPERPQPETRRVPGSLASCELAGVTSWVDVYTTPYVWNATQRAWVLGQETGPVRTGETFTAYTDQEYFEACAPDQPQPVAVPDSKAGCDLSQYGDGFGAGTVTRTGSREYVWDDLAGQWVLEPEPGITWTPWAFTPYGDADYLELCAPDQPASETRRVSGSEASCELAGVTSWVDVYTTPYVWDAASRGWVLGAETGPVRTGEVFTPFTDDEYLEECAPEQPEPLVREVAGAQASCKLEGSRTWVDVYTTGFVWDPATREWVLGEEDGPVRTDETYTPYTGAEFLDHCTDTDGKDPKDPQPRDVVVRGAQQTTPVPTVVDAGLGGAEAPAGRSPNGLWLIAVGGGLLTIGFAGSRRRTTARR